MMEKDLFAEMGDTVEAAVNDLKQGVAFFIETAKERGVPINRIWLNRSI